MKQDVTLEKAAEALKHIDSNDREVWIRMCFAMKNQFGDAGFEVWDKWSQTGATYKPADAKSTWNSAKHGGRVTIASLFYLAKQSGWRGEAPRLPKMSFKEKRAKEARQKKEAEKQARINQNALKQSEQIINACRVENHPYLVSKGFDGIEALVIDKDDLNRILNRRQHPYTEDALVIPIRDRKLKLVSVQLIFPDGEKKFLYGGKFKGFSHVLNSKAMRFILCEGYASGHSILASLWNIHMHGIGVVVCFSTFNMVEMSKLVHKSALVVADHDKKTKDGISPGIAAAIKTGRRYWYPPDEGTDVNDYMQKYGLDALSEEMRKFLQNKA